MSTFEYLSFSWHVGAFLVHVVFDWEALFGELSWFGAKGAMEAAEREGLLSEEAADPGWLPRLRFRHVWMVFLFCAFIANC